MVATSATVAAVASAQTAGGNPELEVGCGLKVMLVLDESSSISTFGATDEVRDAAAGFTEALLGTGSPVAITVFESRGRPGPPEVTTGAGYAEVTEGNLGTFTDWIHNRNQPAGVSGYNPQATVTTFPTPRGTTNWQDAFRQVERTKDGPPNLVVFVTDGDPNTYTNAAGNLVYDTGPSGSLENATNAAVEAAEEVKAHGSRVFAIGVGSAVDNPESAARLQRVSGPVEGANPTAADYTLVTDFAGLRAELAGIVARLCGSSLIVTKYTSEDHGGPWERSPGWKFTATLDTPHTWLEPPGAGKSHTATLTTDEDGAAAFHWRLPAAETTAELGVTKEAAKPGLNFVLAECQTHHVDGTYVERESTTEIPGAVLGREEYHTCQVYNAPERPGGGGGRGPTSGTSCPDCTETVPEPHLIVNKHMPSRALVGERLPVAITVHNGGDGTAREVRVRETPPPGTRIVAAADGGSTEPDGTVVWDVGTLAPHEGRTVHATMVATRPGFHLNTAVVRAADSYPAFDRAPLRDRRPHRPPSFTG